MTLQQIADKLLAESQSNHISVWVEGKITVIMTATQKLFFTAIENVKNDFFRLPFGKEVYRSEGYCRMNKKYTGGAESDISKCTYKKKGTIVEVNFEY